jgi:thioredoxin-like negative regulator of GroEL
MTNQNKSRREKLEEFLAQNPKDAFSRYGLALECIKEQDRAEADKHFRLLLQEHSEYVPAYLMYAQMLVQQERKVEAKSVLATGIDAATRQQNAHARSEMEALLAELS